LVDALDGAHGEGTAADRGVEQLADRGPQGHEFRQSESDLRALLGFEGPLRLEPGPEIAGRAQPGVRERQRDGRTHGVSLTSPLAGYKSGNAYYASSSL